MTRSLNWIGEEDTRTTIETSMKEKNIIKMKKNGNKLKSWLQYIFQTNNNNNNILFLTNNILNVFILFNIIFAIGIAVGLFFARQTFFSIT